MGENALAIHEKMVTRVFSKSLGKNVCEYILKKSEK